MITEHDGVTLGYGGVTLHLTFKDQVKGRAQGSYLHVQEVRRGTTVEI